VKKWQNEDQEDPAVKRTGKKHPRKERREAGRFTRSRAAGESAKGGNFSVTIRAGPAAGQAPGSMISQ